MLVCMSMQEKRKRQRQEAGRDVSACVCKHAHVGHFVCLYAYMHLYVMHVSGGQRLTWYGLQLSFMKRPLIGLKLTNFARLSGYRALRILLPLPLY